MAGPVLPRVHPDGSHQALLLQLLRTAPAQQKAQYHTGGNGSSFPSVSAPESLKDKEQDLQRRQNGIQESLSPLHTFRDAGRSKGKSHQCKEHTLFPGVGLPVHQRRKQTAAQKEQTDHPGEDKQSIQPANDISRKMCQRHGGGCRIDKPCMSCMPIDHIGKCPETGHCTSTGEPDVPNRLFKMRHIPGLSPQMPQTPRRSEPAEQFIPHHPLSFLQRKSQLQKPVRFHFPVHEQCQEEQKEQKERKQDLADSQTAFQPLVQIIIAEQIEPHQNDPERRTGQQKALHKDTGHAHQHGAQYPVVYITQPFHPGR